MKRKETTPGGSVDVCVVLERRTYEDRPAKRCNIESRVSNGDTISSSSRRRRRRRRGRSRSSGSHKRGPINEVQTPCFLWSATSLEEDEA
jgi:hypothetical protein